MVFGRSRESQRDAELAVIRREIDAIKNFLDKRYNEMAKTQDELNSEISTLSGVVDNEIASRKAGDTAAYDKISDLKSELAAALAAANPDQQAAFDSVAAIIAKFQPT